MSNSASCLRPKVNYLRNLWINYVFLFFVRSITSYFKHMLRHTKLLHTTAPGYKGWRKKSLRERRNIFLSDRDPQRFSFIILSLIILPLIFLYYTTFILICDVLYSFRFYYTQFKEFKILWGPRAGGRITQRPYFFLKYDVKSY